MSIEELVYRITTFNHNWKRAKELWGADSYLAIMLRNRKSDLQVQLLDMDPPVSYLKLDTDNSDENEPLYSVRLVNPVTLRNGVERADADHLPVRLALEFFSEEQIVIYTK